MADSQTGILSTKGVEFCDFPLEEDPELDLVAFNDLSLVDGWVHTLRVEDIREIVLYEGQDGIVGIELVYTMSNGNPSPRITHGLQTKTCKKIDVGDSKRVIAAYVGIDTQHPTEKNYNRLKSLCFTITDMHKGEPSTEGITSPLANLEYKAAFGEISAFRGTKIRGGRLVTLGVQTRCYGPATRTLLQPKSPMIWGPNPDTTIP